MLSQVLSTGVPLLTTSNYAQWYPMLEDYLRSKGIWYWLKESLPSKTDDAKGYQECMKACDEAVGEICRHVSLELRGSIATLKEADGILEHLKKTYGNATFSTRYNALCALLSTRQKEGEKAADFAARAGAALTHLKLCRGDKFTVQDSETELMLMTLLTGTTQSITPESLLVQGDLTVPKVIDALQNAEETSSRKSDNPAAAAAAASAAAAAAHTCGPSCGHLHAAAAASSASNSLVCSFCGKSGHSADHCFKFQDAQRKAKEEVAAATTNKRN